MLNVNRIITNWLISANERTNANKIDYVSLVNQLHIPVGRDCIAQTRSPIFSIKCTNFVNTDRCM